MRGGKQGSGKTVEEKEGQPCMGRCWLAQLPREEGTIKDEDGALNRIRTAMQGADAGERG